MQCHRLFLRVVNPSHLSLVAAPSRTPLATRIPPIMRAHSWLVLIIAAFVALASLYSVVTPIFEAGDELWHYPFVQSLATGHSLPVQDPNVKTLWEQEGGQPPLYYAVAAMATFWIDTGDLTDRLWRNPEAKIGIPLDFGNKNMVVHTSAEDFPWHNTALAVHLLRFLSIFFSALTILFIYLLALEIRDDRTLASIAAALVAFNPMFLFISASVNNDNLAVMLAALALLLFARLMTLGSTRGRFVVLGIVLGLGALSKVSDLGLLVVAAGVFAYVILSKATPAPPARAGENLFANNETLTHSLPLSLRSGSASSGSASFAHGDRLKRVLFSSMLCAVLVVVIAGWWYARNWLLYGDPWAFNVWVAIAGGRPTPATLATLLGEFQGFRISYWGNFGGVNIIAPDWVYTILDAFTAIAAIGLLIGLVRRKLPRLLVLPAVWLALILLALVRWTWLTFASQGRLIFPAIGSVAILMVYGLAQFEIPHLRLVPMRFAPRIFLVPLAVFLFAFSALAPLALIAPTYVLPLRLPGDASVPNPTFIRFDDQAELVGYALPEKSVAPGGELPITVYWRAVVGMTEDYSVYLRLFDTTGNVVGRWEAFPGGGLYPTRLWQPGELIVDAYRVPVGAGTPGVGRIEVGLFRRAPLENLTARDPRGNVVTPTITRFKLAGQVQAQAYVPKPEDVDFGDKIALVGSAFNRQISPGSMLQVKLDWRALAPMSEDYTVFVHLLDEKGKTIAQDDNQPQQGAYPTSFWDVNEAIADEYSLEIPTDTPGGDYQIQIGVYRARDGARLPIRNGGDAMGLGKVQIVR